MSRAAVRFHAALSLLGAMAALGVAWERMDGSELRFPPGQAPVWPVQGWKVDLDVASEEELQALPGVGPRLARSIVTDRQARGAFGSVEALDRVKGVGASMIERLRPHVRAGPQAATVAAPGG